MKLLHSSPVRAMEYHLRNVLQGAGIACFVKNEILGMAAGDLPPTECWVELWVLDDDRFEDAQRILENGPVGEGASLEEWQCPACGEQIEAQFTQCWHCGETRRD